MKATRIAGLTPSVLLALGVLFSAQEAHAVDAEPSQNVKLQGPDELYKADVYPSAGKNRLAVDAAFTTGTVQQGLRDATASTTSPWYVNLRSAAGVELDPRARTWTMSSGTDSVAVSDGSGPLTVDGTVAVTQSTSPWVTSRTWALLSGTDSVTVTDGSGALTVDGTVAVTQSTSPWLTSRSWSLASGTDSVTVTDGTGALTVDGTVAVTQSTSPWVTSRNWNLGFAADSVTSRTQDGSGNAITSQVSGSQRALDVGINVAGAQVDPRTRTWNLSSSDVPLVSQGTAAASSGGWPIKITDGTSTAAVKAASTAPAAADPALVVVLSPNGAQATAANQTTGNASLSSIDTKLTTTNTNTGNTATSTASIDTKATTSNTNTGATATSTASIDTKLTTTNSSLSTIDGGIPAALGQTTMAASMPVTLASNQTPIPTAPNEKSSYTAAFSGLVTAALATDIACIIGSATKTVRVLNVYTTGTTTAGSGNTINLSIIKRSTASTGGTSSTLTIAPHDSNNAAATAVARTYTVNPTVLGTSVGSVCTERLQIATVGQPSTDSDCLYADNTEQAVTLRGVAEQLCINFSGTTITGSLVSGFFQFTEE